MDEVESYDLIRGVDNEKIEYDLHQYRMDIFVKYLIQGVHFDFAQLPTNDKTALLLEGLKEHGFISRDTKLAHFRVLFGIPLAKQDTPFEPIKWRKNKQLLRYFIYSLFPRKTIIGRGYFAIRGLFSNKHGEPINIPSSDLKRLEQSYDYPILVELLNNFNDCGF